MKNFTEKFLFFILNIFLSSCYIELILIELIAFLLMLILPKPSNDEDSLYFFFVIPILLAPVMFFIKLNALNFLYKKLGTGFIHEFLEKFLNDTNFRKKIFASVFYIDLMLFVLFYLIKLLDYHGLLGYIKITAVLTLLFGGNLTTSYLRFYVFSHYKNLKFKLTFLNIAIFIFATISISLLLQSIFVLKEFSFLFFIIIALPIVPLIVLKKISRKFNWKNITVVLLSIIIGLVNTFYLLLIEIFLIVLQTNLIFPFSLCAKSVDYKNYLSELSNLKRMYGSEKLSHFPEKFQENISNYYFRVEDSFDGRNMHYVKFLAVENYIASIKNKYKGKCEILTTKENIKNLDLDIYSDEIKQADKICILHKSSQNERYTSGISIYKNNTIYFFYQDF